VSVPTLTIDDSGASVDWHVRAGCLWRSDFQSVIDGEPENITDATISARVTASASSTTALKTFTVTKSAPTAGRWYITVADSAADLAAGTYWWAMEIDTGAGDEPLMSGKFIVSPWVVA
jgi:hypothetical protein